ncbi:MAG: hypothetical protein IKM94_04525 [Alphaproteobacteria bacterium]|nr:hypothetical protein [Alphaproteobacteria bacterium]
MKKNKTNIKYSLFTSVIFTSMIVTTCHGIDKQTKIERLDNQIAELDKKITQTTDVKKAPIPKNLNNVKPNKQITDSVQNNADSTEFYYTYNDSLINDAFNKYAMRIGHDFQISQFLSKNDILVFQKHLAKLDSTDFIHEQARKRILNNNGSLNDLSYFLEIIDYDSVNHELENKLSWNFDSYFDVDTDSIVLTPVLSFDTTYKNGININNALATEQKLLNLAWNKPDTNTVVPEIDSMYKNSAFTHNDSVLRKRDEYAQKAIHLEDSLYEYKNTLTRARDSLMRERNKLEK